MLHKTLALTLTAAALAAAPALLSASFLGAPVGVAVPFQRLALPPVSLPPVDVKDAWSPRARTLLEGQALLTTADQAHDVWKRLFNQPFDPSLVDFRQDFVVLMGGGLQTTADFEISCVEMVDATWADLGGTQTDPFLALTATTTLPGVPPPNPPPPSWRLSAVVVSRAFNDDPVYHRRTVALP